MKNNNFFKVGFVVLLVVVLYMLYNNHNNISKLNKQLIQQEKLTNALMDTMITTKNSYGEIVNSKLTIQADINNLINSSINFSENQRRLLQRVSELQKNSDVIAAALITTTFKLDSLLDGYNVVVDNLNNTVSFSDSTEHLVYDIMVTNVAPVLPKVKPLILFNRFEAPNDYYIDFSWDKNKRANYPVSFTITNTNPLFVTQDINSYVIPEIDKNNLKPSWWKRTTKFVGKYGEYVVIGGVVYLITVITK